MLAKICGIYAIEVGMDGPIYIGQSQNCRVRFNHHRHQLRKGTHGNPRLQNIWTKHGEAVLSFRVIEECDLESLTVLEQAHVDAFAQAGREILNCGSVVDCPARGRKFGPQPKELRDKKSDSLKGRERSEAHRKNLSEAQKGKTFSEETRAKMRAAKLGKKQTEEHKRKAAEARRGKPHPVNEVARNKLIARNKAMVLTEDARERMRQASTGRTLTPEARAKCSAAAKKYWAEKAELRV